MPELVVGLLVLVVTTMLSISQHHLEVNQDPRAGSLSLARSLVLVLGAAIWLAMLSMSAPFAGLLAFVLLFIWFTQQAAGRLFGGRQFAKTISKRLDWFVTKWSKLVAPIRLAPRLVVEDYEQELIESVEDFAETVVREVMVPRVDLETVEGSETLEQALAVFISSGYSRLPVIGKDVDDILGVLYLKDLARVTHQDPALLAETTAAQACRKPLFTPESKPVAALLQQMQKSGTQIAIVSDEYGGVAGIATLEDLIEELVGEITDEYDRETEDIELIDVDLYRVNPRVTLDELSERCEMELEDDDVDTIGGLLVKANGQLPKGGEVLEILGLELTAERVDARRGRILSILVRKLELQDD